MSNDARPDTQSCAPHVADSHDLIRVQGARENNLKNVSVEIPKRRLTVFTGVSGSGKSSLVFDTIAAESRRLINETYSTFVQNFMPTLARPEVDRLDGLTPAIIVDQERMGANSRSTVGTATDANAMLRVLFSRLGKPHIGSRRRSRSTSLRLAGLVESPSEGLRQVRERRSSSPAACVRAARAWARERHRPRRALRRRQVARRGRYHDPRLHRRRLAGAPVHRVGLRRSQTRRSATTPSRSARTSSTRSPRRSSSAASTSPTRGSCPRSRRASCRRTAMPCSRTSARSSSARSSSRPARSATGRA